MAHRTQYTFCRICSPNCPLLAEYGEDGEIVALRPDREHPVSRGYACNKGLEYLDIHHDSDRLNWPLRRTNPRTDQLGHFERVSWDRAFEDIGQRLRAIRDRYGVDAIGVYAGNPIAFNSKAFGGVYSFAGRLGTRRSFNAGTQDLSNKFKAAQAVFGSSVLPIPDFHRTNYLLCVGANPKISRWTGGASVNRPVDVLQDIVSRGGKVVFVNPRRIESASAKTGEVVPIRPDTDVYFLAALIHEIDARGGFKDEVIARHGKHVEGLRAFIARYPAERVAGVTGIAAEVIRGIARDFMLADGASTHNATGVNQGRQGTLATWLLMMLSFVTGNLGRDGGEYYARGYARTLAPAAEDVAVETEFGRLRPVFGALPGALLADFMEVKANPIRALIVFSGNPLLSIGGEDRLRRLLPNLDLIVSVDVYRNTTGEYADYLLPAADWLERDDMNSTSIGGQPTPYAQYTPAVVEPHFERKEDWWILARLEQVLGMPSLLDDANPDPRLVDKEMLAQSGLSIESLAEMPHLTALLPQAPRDSFFDDAVLSPDRKVDCCPTSFADAFERCEAIFVELENEPPEQLKLISLRTNYMHNGSLSNMKSLKRGVHAINPLHIHPLDGRARGLADGDTARIFNKFGEVVTPVTLDDTLSPGVVALSHGYGHVNSPGTSLAHAAPGVNANRLMPTGPGTFEPLSNMSHMTGVSIEVEKVASPPFIVSSKGVDFR